MNMVLETSNCTVAEHCGIGTLTLGSSQRIVAADASFCRQFFCERHDVEGRNLEDLLSRRDIEGALSLHRNLSRSPGNLSDFAVEFCIGGQVFHARLRLAKLGTGWLALSEKVTDGGLLYTLLVARERWGAVFRRSDDGIVVLSEQNRILEHNQRFFELMQFRSVHGVLLSDEALVGRSLLDLLPRNGLGDLRKAIVDSSAEDFAGSAALGGRSLEFKMVRISVPVRGKVGTCLLVRDVSERKQVEELRLRQAEAHYAGMAEVANGILHNLGNMCGSILFLSEELAKLLGGSEVVRLAKATELLRSHSRNLTEYLTTDEKGQLLPELYLRLGDALQREHQRVVNISGELTAKVQLMKDAIATQQTYAKGTRFMELLDLEVIVEDALHIEQMALERHGCRIVKNLESVGSVRVQRSKLVHVLLNLIKNAIESMDHVDKERLLSVDLGRLPTGQPFVSIADTGSGIAKEHLARLFTHGFSTKQTGHGFGLHFCALAMEEMGGGIRAESLGPGAGAKFVLTFPEESSNGERAPELGRAPASSERERREEGGG